MRPRAPELIYNPRHPHLLPDRRYVFVWLCGVNRCKFKLAHNPTLNSSSTTTLNGCLENAKQYMFVWWETMLRMRFSYKGFPIFSTEALIGNQPTSVLSSLVVGLPERYLQQKSILTISDCIFLEIPINPVISTRMPLSSKISRFKASCKDSPCSTIPPGNSQPRRGCFTNHFK